MKGKGEATWFRETLKDYTHRSLAEDTRPQETIRSLRMGVIIPQRPITLSFHHILIRYECLVRNCWAKVIHIHECETGN